MGAFVKVYLDPRNGALVRKERDQRMAKIAAAGR